ncbi:MAG: hypothetical protein ACREV5_12815 [Steroidobacter sp.]
MLLSDMWKPVLALALCCIGLAGMLSGGPIERAAGVLAPYEPTQAPTRAAPFRIGEHQLTPRAAYDIEARVLSTEPYSFDAGARLSPLDFAVGWGPMSDTAVLEHFRVSQSARFFTIYPDEEAIDLDAALLSGANMHLIPATSDVEDQLEDVRAGHVVRLRGLLVNVSGPNGWTWNTSLTRNDSGAGACELFYVESVERR